MKHRDFRKIIINNKEYDWLYVDDDTWCSSTINVFEVSYIKHNIRKWKKDIRKRKMMFKYHVDSNMQITPKKIRELILYGHFLSKKEERKYKLMILNEK